MPRRDIDGTYVNMDIMFANPTSSEMGFLVEAYAKIGYYASVAETTANEFETELKVAEANAFLEAKNSDEKRSVEALRSIALINTQTERRQLDEAKAGARKLKALHESIEQAINAIKFLDRNGGVRIG
jgi:hypothetical protein